MNHLIRFQIILFLLTACHHDKRFLQTLILPGPTIPLVYNDFEKVYPLPSKNAFIAFTLDQNPMDIDKKNSDQIIFFDGNREVCRSPFNEFIHQEIWVIDSGKKILIQADLGVVDTRIRLRLFSLETCQVNNLDEIPSDIFYPINLTLDKQEIFSISQVGEKKSIATAVKQSENFQVFVGEKVACQFNPTQVQLAYFTNERCVVAER